MSMLFAASRRLKDLMAGELSLIDIRLRVMAVVKSNGSTDEEVESALIVAHTAAGKLLERRARLRKRWVNVAYKRVYQAATSRTGVVLPYDLMCDKYGLYWPEMTRWQGL